MSSISILSLTLEIVRASRRGDGAKEEKGGASDIGEWWKFVRDYRSRVIVKDFSNAEHFLNLQVYRALGPRNAEKLGLIYVSNTPKPVTV